ncbi:unnamed protein product [Polarella glacialis]|uniref:EF-hand domain-containing protein n=1 Tax=Polarella glacialis TaxID=89957 RepID=A0A813FM86_POLGL|nr:unnamed protein product [Polarella glacialis]CAE8651583.1 unnamed protein product [Polarella glacialis]
MGVQQSLTGQSSTNGAFSPKELYNLKQVYFYLCLHTTTLTSCPLDRNQFYSLFGNHRQYKPLWRALFSAIDVNGDSVIDFEEFLTFVTQLKRGDVEEKRKLSFRMFDSNQDGIAEKADFRCFVETKVASLRKPSWQSQGESSGDEYTSFFTLCDENADGQISLEDFQTYCGVHGEGIVNQTLKLLEVMFDGVIEETGIIITATDVRNTKPHIDWQDHRMSMGSLFCCSSAPPVFTTPPVA